jgi:hypothetical protein
MYQQEAMTMTSAMTGTSRQIAWAEDIKVDVMSRLDDYLAMLIDRLADKAAADSQAMMIRNWFDAQTDAAWWIDDCRDSDGLVTTTRVMDLVKRAVAELQSR